jgi:hypothetical protein
MKFTWRNCSDNPIQLKPKRKYLCVSVVFIAVSPESWKIQKDEPFQFDRDT